MTWLKVHDTIRHNRKILMAADQLRIDSTQMIGHMCLFWLWAIENAPDGKLNVSDDMIARVCGSSKSGRSFVQALIVANLLTQSEIGSYEIVNFDEHIKPILDAAEKAREKQALYRQRMAAGYRKPTPGAQTELPAS